MLAVLGRIRGVSFHSASSKRRPPCCVNVPRCSSRSNGWGQSYLSPAMVTRLVRGGRPSDSLPPHDRLVRASEPSTPPRPALGLESLMRNHDPAERLLRLFLLRISRRHCWATWQKKRPTRWVPTWIGRQSLRYAISQPGLRGAIRRCSSRGSNRKARHCSCLGVLIHARVRRRAVATACLHALLP